MNIRKRQASRFSARWWKYNRKYWASWAINAAHEKAEEYAEFFSKSVNHEAGGNHEK